MTSEKLLDTAHTKKSKFPRTFNYIFIIVLKFWSKIRDRIAARLPLFLSEEMDYDFGWLYKNSLF